MKIKINNRIYFVPFLFAAIMFLLLFSKCSEDKKTPVEPTNNEEELPVQASFVFTNVNVVPMNEEKVIPNQTVVILDGKISQIVPQGSLEFPNSTPQIDAGGFYLMPGLGDMHAHLVNDEQSKNDLLLYIANGVTTVRFMWGFTRFLNWREEVKSGATIGPNIYSASPGFEGRSSGFPGSILFSSTDQARQQVINQKNRGYDFIKVFNNLTLDEYLAITDEAKNQDIRVIGHVPFAFNIDQVIDSPSPQVCVEHLAGYSRSVTNTGSWATGDINESSLSDLAERTLERGIWHCPTITVGSRMISQVNQLSRVPELRFVSPAVVNWLQQTVTQPPNFDSRKSDENRKHVVKVFNDKGVKLLLGTDGAFFWVLPGFGIHEELNSFVDAGLTPYQAFRAGTINVAEFLENSDEFGTIAIGKRADLVLLKENPLEGVENFRNRVGVMINGKWFTEDTLQEMLDELAESYGN